MQSCELHFQSEHEKSTLRQALNFYCQNLKTELQKAQLSSKVIFDTPQMQDLLFANQLLGRLDQSDETVFYFSSGHCAFIKTVIKKYQTSGVNCVNVEHLQKFIRQINAHFGK